MIVFLWFMMGLCGYFMILHAYKQYNGYHDPDMKMRMLPAIILGPIALMLGGYMLWDVNKE